MKILFFTENSHAGGLDIFLVTLINNWPQDDDQITVICNQSHPGLAEIKKRTVRNCRFIAHEIPMLSDHLNKFPRIPFRNLIRKIVSVLFRYPYFYSYMRKVGNILRDENPDRLMVVNGGYPAGDSCRAAAAAWLASATGRPNCIFNFHNLVVRPRWWEKIPENIIDRLVVRGTGSFVSVSEACAQTMSRRPTIFNSSRVGHILNGIVDATPVDYKEVQDIRSELGISDSAPVCLMMGTYEPRKGHQFLFDAFKIVLKKVPNALLIVCGFGYENEINKVRTLAQKMGLESQIRLLDFRDDTDALIEIADILLVSSQAFESFGLTIVEAMARSTPVVATNIGGIPEVIGENEGGFCLSADDEISFAKQIIDLLENKPMRSQMGKLGRQRYLEKFTAKRMAQEYASLIALS